MHKTQHYTRIPCVRAVLIKNCVHPVDNFWVSTPFHSEHIATSIERAKCFILLSLSSAFFLQEILKSWIITNTLLLLIVVVFLHSVWRVQSVMNVKTISDVEKTVNRISKNCKRLTAMNCPNAKSRGQQCPSWLFSEETL